MCHIVFLPLMLHLGSAAHDGATCARLGESLNDRVAEGAAALHAVDCFPPPLETKLCQGCLADLIWYQSSLHIECMEGKQRGPQVLNPYFLAQTPLMPICHSNLWKSWA